MQITTVLRSGGEYTPDHVILMHSQLQKLGWGLTVIADPAYGSYAWPAGIVVRIIYEADRQFPGWWFKCNMFYDLVGDTLFADLDTVFVGALDEIGAMHGDIVLRDFYRGGRGIGSGFMRLTPATKLDLMRAWSARSAEIMAFCGQKGDQHFLELAELMLPHVRFWRWQDLLPGHVCSYKAHIRDVKAVDPPASARVVCFHGTPRPWNVIDPVHRAWIDAAGLVNYRLG